MPKMRFYFVLTLFLMLFLTANYLEFPVHTVLILGIVVYLWFMFRSSSPNQINFPQIKFPAVDLLSFSLPSRGNARNRNVRSQLLAGIRGFSLSIFADKPAIMPFIGIRAGNCVKEFLHENHLIVDQTNAWISDPNLANLRLTVVIQASGGNVHITVVAEIEGMVSVTRSFADNSLTVSDSSILKTYSDSRVNRKALVVQEVEKAIHG
ncbi:MAG: hypothetical protein IAF58_00605, partial [Leptolyngbya sp.]|nr:hypothetical protein [Candidatus Melainabacteria bacterium]